jgi:hypothetical protein
MIKGRHDLRHSAICLFPNGLGHLLFAQNLTQRSQEIGFAAESHLSETAFSDIEI